MSDAGVGDADPDLQAYPALQLAQAMAPGPEYVPAGHASAGGVATVEPDGHTYPPAQGPEQKGEVVPLAAP
jgi:hypothetical protein